MLGGLPGHCVPGSPLASATRSHHERRAMVDPDLPLYANRPLTPRQDGIEATIERVLRAGGTRSELRDAVYQFADHARMQQIPPERAITMIKAVAMRASTSSAAAASSVGESMAARLATLTRRLSRSATPPAMRERAR